MTSRKLEMLALTLALGMAAGVACAQDPAAAADSTAFVAAPAAEAATPAAPTTALDREVESIRAAYRARLEELTAAYRAAPDAAAAMAAQRGIADLKATLELDLLDLQLRLARERNDAEALAELDAARSAAAARLGIDIAPAPSGRQEAAR